MPQSQGPSRNKIVIIGGGVAGLCAGAYALASGYEVELLEQHTIPGGLATSWRRGDYTFETCLHWLLGSAPDGMLGAQWREVCDLDHLTFVYHAEYLRLETEDGRTLSIFSDPDRMEAEFLARVPEDADEIKAFTAAIRAFADFPMQEMMNAAWLKRGVAILRFLPRLPALQHWASMTCEEYGQRFKNDLLRRFFTSNATASMSAVTLVFMFAWMSQKNAGYPIGGAKAVIDLLVTRFRELGGALRLMAKGEEILVEEDRAVGVRLADGEIVRGDWIISAADGHATIYDLLHGRYRDAAIDRFYAEQEVFPSYLQVSLGLAQELSQEPGFVTRVLKAPLQIDPETQLDAISFRIFNFDPSFASKGKTAVTCFLPTSNFAYWADLQHSDHRRYQAEKDRIAEIVIAILERRLPGVRQWIDTMDVSTPASVIHFTGNWKGSMEGFVPTPKTGFGVRRQTLPGLSRFLMVGQWVQPGGGLPAGLMTARAAIQTICRRDDIHFSPGA